ncbi:transposase [Burkholderia pseudomallei]|nr:transposase [Burkholderia pseudomallei]EEC34927.1 integrase, catalytic region [Burkholderia pseudomallei 576]ARK61255.1 transposase [Burkholderia pseudomallei]ARK70359.1 transposase [Burkholderia pseudomallei]ARK93500.1 transposase [Burkholderia pseudomallei]
MRTTPLEFRGGPANWPCGEQIERWRGEYNENQPQYVRQLHLQAQLTDQQNAED